MTFQFFSTSILDNMAAIALSIHLPCKQLWQQIRGLACLSKEQQQQEQHCTCSINRYQQQATQRTQPLSIIASLGPHLSCSASTMKLTIRGGSGCSSPHRPALDSRSRSPSSRSSLSCSSRLPQKILGAD